MAEAYTAEVGHPSIKGVTIKLSQRGSRWMVIGAVNKRNGQVQDGLEVLASNNLTLRSFDVDQEPVLISKDE